MSKESNNNQKNSGNKQMPVSMPGGLRALAADVFDKSPNSEPERNVPKNQTDADGTNSNQNLSSSGLFDFRNFLEDYRNGNSERVAVYITPEVRDVLDRLKTAESLKKYSMKDLVNSIVHAYILEHREEIKQILSMKKNNNILD